EVGENRDQIESHGDGYSLIGDRRYELWILRWHRQAQTADYPPPITRCAGTSFLPPTTAHPVPACLPGVAIRCAWRPCRWRGCTPVRTGPSIPSPLRRSL